MDEQEAAPRALHSRNKIPIRFQNLTNHNIDIIWINFSGEYVKYAMIASRGFIDINTFETHPWIAINSMTKDRMLINSKFIYLPKHWQEEVGANHNLLLRFMSRNMIPRVLIPVTIPLYSLRHRTLLEIGAYLKSESDVNGLDLPKHLKDDLKSLITLRNNFPLSG